MIAYNVLAYLSVGRTYKLLIDTHTGDLADPNYDPIEYLLCVGDLYHTPPQLFPSTPHIYWNNKPWNISGAQQPIDANAYPMSHIRLSITIEPYEC